MQTLLTTWQTLPSLISPYLLDFGTFKLHWYGLMYVAAFAAVLVLVFWRRKKGETEMSKDLIWKYAEYGIGGILIGGRLGYVLFYDLAYYLSHPLQVIWPFADGELVGIAGMSFHGGVVGILVTSWLFARTYKIDLWKLAALFIPAMPFGHMFGRFGNFINGELWGRETAANIGMYFSADRFELLRHPSQLYEALGEGFLIFLVLWSLRSRLKDGRMAVGLYFILYSVARFVIEFFREPDAHLGLLWFELSMGQLLSIVMLVAGIGLIIYAKKKN
jgi:phosphatidylglycerol---prolipoprotein diacylglyceryl transferase